MYEHRGWYEELARLGYTDIWSSESSGYDAFTPLTLAAAWAPALRLGTAIVPVYTRGPATLAQCVASICAADFESHSTASLVLPWDLALEVAFVALVMCVIASFVAIHKIKTIDPTTVFR